MSDDEETTIWIFSTRDRFSYGPACRIVWDELEWYAAVREVRSTAYQLILCAAYSDVIGQFLKMGLDGPSVGQMLSEMMSTSPAVAELWPKHKPRDGMLGSKHTVQMVPVGSSKQKAGGVRGGKQLEMTAGDAVRVAMHWLVSAEASESDTLFSNVVERSQLLNEFETDALFGLLGDIRSGEATMPPLRESAP